MDTVSNKNKPNFCKLPFGSNILISRKLPNQWTIPPYWDCNKNDSLCPNDTIGRRLDHFYDSLTQCKSYSLPEIKSIVRLYNFKRIEMDPYGRTPQNCIDSILMDSYQIQFPDLGIYSCYYSSKDYPWGRPLKTGCAPNQYVIFGNLILYDSMSKAAILMPICAMENEECSYMYRYFYITRNKEIIIYEGEGDEENRSLQEKYAITMSSSGKINIKNIKE
jgi:hypothetical protein